MRALRQQIDEFQLLCLYGGYAYGIAALVTEEPLPLWVVVFITALTSAAIGTELTLRAEVRRTKKAGVFGDKKDEGGSA